MEILGYIAAALIGMSLGLIGGGGSVLTLPVLVYLFGITPAAATSYSLFIVGSTSLVGAIGNYRKKRVNIPIAMLFGIPSIAAVWLTRHFLMPVIPVELFKIGGFMVGRELALMLLFAGLMLLASFSMILGKSREPETGKPMDTTGKIRLVLYGALIGGVTGLLGAGGGFLIIPALIMIAGLPMKTAVGTSLMIMAMSTLIGFMGDTGHADINWTLLLVLSAIAVAGVLAGGLLSRRIPGARLKHAFGWFVLAMGVYIILLETWLK
ncbi:sulfite exporter TauE/SafE family protein [Chitinophaga qingshengii]|uniref:Probable membrane transporter protein n=1 Tax=Chitinophaga qingshengii TaxID=1569794 RepID=A0ABR7TFH2_9BACT|nr:sulfite exporter TauE/SafE family protein [Chitinophaga qingshengii]MBC9929077.1 sulfite exporter TauE/SafE family protein [Chitinophaga qingshengii]